MEVNEDRGTGRSRAQIEGAVAHALCGQHVFYVTPGLPDEWMNMARAVANERGHGSRTYFAKRRVAIGDGAITFIDHTVWNEAYAEAERRPGAASLFGVPVIIDHAAKVAA